MKFDKLTFFLFITTILITIFIQGCSKNEEKLIPDEKFVEVLSDLMIIEKLPVSESEKIKLTKAIFNKYQVDTLNFNRTRTYYSENESYWIKIYSKTEERLKTKLDSVKTSQVDSVMIKTN